MRTTIEIKEKLERTEAEIQRITDLLSIHEESEKFILRDGTLHPEWTFNDALNIYVADKLLLKWVLKSN